MPNCRVALLALVGAAVFLSPGRVEAGPWRRVQSPHFTVSGNVGEREARDVAARLEQFREVLTRIFPKARLSVRPLFVVAFDSEQAYKPYKPLYAGKPAPFTGYFSWNSDGNCVTLQLDRGEESYPIIFHEYTHLFATQSSRHLPSWLSEGIAEYYSTVEIVGHGQRANIGRPVLNHLRLLAQRFMPLSDLLSVTQSSRIWNDREEAALFYAESWALVHYLSSLPEGARKVSAYVQRVEDGASAPAAFGEVFGPVASVEPALRRYIQGSSYGYWRFDFKEKVDAERAPARTMTAGEVEAVLATVLINIGRLADAEPHVAAAIKSSPDAAEPYIAQGLLLRRQGHSSKAEEAFRAAVERGPGNLDAAYYWGLSLAELRTGERADLERALGALVAAIPKDDAPADALTVVGALQYLTDRTAEAETSLRRSLALAPGQTRATIALADLLIRQQRFAEARSLLAGMIARPNSQGEANIARNEMDWLERAEAAAARERNAPAPREREHTENREPAAASPASDVERASANRFSPLYRQVGQGEERQPGVLEQITCTPHGLVLQLTTQAGTKRYHAPNFDAVEFIAYRDDLRGTIPCGPRPNREAVYLTWKATNTAALPAALGRIDGRVVAVEFLPK